MSGSSDPHRVPLLRAGSRGDAVRELQERLTGAGHVIAASGVFDAATEQAVRTFQQARGLLVDGICGPDTWGALIESAYRLGDRLLYLRQPLLRGDDVANLQRRLNALGFFAGREDGILGTESEGALRQFQRGAGLATDGVCGPATVAALGRLGALADGSVAQVRERETMRRDHRRLADRTFFVAAAPGLEVLATDVVRGLRTAGADVAGPAYDEDTSAVATSANQSGADLVVGLGPGAGPGVRCAYFATEHFRSEAGFAIAGHLTAELGRVCAGVEPPVGRTYRLLRETRMAAVVCELFSPDDPAGAHALRTRVPAITAAIVAGIRRWVEGPLAS